MYLRLGALAGCQLGRRAGSGVQHVWLAQPVCVRGLVHGLQTPFLLVSIISSTMAMVAWRQMQLLMHLLGLQFGE